MKNINATKRLNEVELKEGYEGNRSWHHQWKDSAYIYVGGLHEKLTEGDIVTVFSQFGDIVDVKLARDKRTGKSRCFGWICYEDQRSTILATDNMNGEKLVGRTLNVNHADYKAQKELDHDDLDENGDPKLIKYQASGAEGKGYQVYNALESEKKLQEVYTQREAEIAQKVQQREEQDDDEVWAKQFEESLKTQESLKETSKKLKKEKKVEKKIMKAIKKMKKERKMWKKAIKRKKKLDKKEAKEKAGRNGVKVPVKEEMDSTASSPDSSCSDEEESDEPPPPKDAKVAKVVKPDRHKEKEDERVRERSRRRSSRT
mmetsp:Transcript_21878/g.51091  ORF Transcript_21878/g.51091 Transcript_21878/m.51091 type:complete len:316 (+) Transcript_21878:57-1004(+)